MKPNKNFVRLVMAASSLAIVQGLVWTILCLLGIFVYFEAWVPKTDETTHIGKLGHTLYRLFSAYEAKLLVLLILYLILSVIWTGISVFLMITIQRMHNNKTRWAMLTWSGWTILTCTYDVAAVGVFASDYHNSVTGILEYYILAEGVLFCIAARGYVLWCINLVFAVIILKHAMKSKQNDGDNYNNSIDVYGGERRRSFESNGNVNNGFDWENQNRPPYQQTNSYASSVQGYARPNVPPKPNYNDRMSGLDRQRPNTQPNYNDRVAGLGRQHPNTHSHSVPPPKPPTTYIYPKRNPSIPTPDYSPPNSPLKSALKNRPTQNPFIFSRNGNGNGNGNGRY